MNNIKKTTCITFNQGSGIKIIIINNSIKIKNIEFNGKPNRSYQITKNETYRTNTIKICKFFFNLKTLCNLSWLEHHWDFISNQKK